MLKKSERSATPENYLRRCSFLSDRSIDHLLSFDLHRRFAASGLRVVPLYFWLSREGYARQVTLPVRLAVVFGPSLIDVRKVGQEIHGEIASLQVAFFPALQEAEVPVFFGAPRVNGVLDATPGITCDWWRIEIRGPGEILSSVAATRLPTAEIIAQVRASPVRAWPEVPAIVRATREPLESNRGFYGAGKRPLYVVFVEGEGERPGSRP